MVKQNSIDSHQTSPAYVLTFTRLSNRDTINYKNVGGLETRPPLVVVNDAIAITIQFSKSNPSPTFSCILKQGDLNYLTAIHPGDFVIVNMVNWESKAMKIRDRALASEQINREEDGFKGLFKILDVNMSLAVGSLGEKQYQVQVTARGFDEFNNVLYFNPAMVETLSKQGDGLLFLNSFNNFRDLVQQKDQHNVQKLVKEIIHRTIGQGLAVDLKEGTKLNQIPAYQIPDQIKKLLGIPNARTVADINKYYLGIWDSLGFTPYEVNSKNKSNVVSFFKTKQSLQGSRQVFIGDFQSVSVWSLLQDYSNSILNESYTCYKKAPDGNVYPSVIVRQKPFNTNHYESFCDKKATISNHTKFLDIPAWEISPDIITSLNIGRSDHGRINFVQVFSRQLTVGPEFDASRQMVEGNFVEDKEDVLRHGRKPYIVTCNYDPPSSTKDSPAKAREWAYLLADWLFNGHLKMNGNIQTVGIEEPICVGDNLELDGIVYHIETITHTINISNEGVKIFRTNMSLSMGMSKKSSKNMPVYAEMDYTDAESRRKDDFNKKEGLLPGFSDTQDIPLQRVDGEEITKTHEATFTNPKSFNKGNKK